MGHQTDMKHQNLRLFKEFIIKRTHKIKKSIVLLKVIELFKYVISNQNSPNRTLFPPGKMQASILKMSRCL